MIRFGADEHAPLGAAVRGRPGRGRAGGPDGRRGGSGRPHRPELRLPGAQGHPQGRRLGAARTSAGCSSRSSRTAVRTAAAGQTSRSPSRCGSASTRSTSPICRRRPDRRGLRASPRSRCTAAPRSSTTRARPTGTRSAPLKQAGHQRSRCWATATSSPPSDALAMMAATGCDGVVVGRGCQGRPWLFAELAAAFEGRPRPTPPDLRAVAGDPAPARRTAVRRDGPRPRHPRPAQTHRLVPQGIRRRIRAAAAARHGVQPDELDDAAGRARPGPAVPGRRRTARAAGRGRRSGGSSCPTAGWTTRSPRSCRRGRSWMTAAGERPGPGTSGPDRIAAVARRGC